MKTVSSRPPRAHHRSHVTGLSVNVARTAPRKARKRCVEQKQTLRVWKREPRFSAMREVGAQMVPIKLHLLADERRPRGVPASRLEGVVVRKGKGKGKGAHGESLLFDPGEAHDCLRQFEHVLVAPPPGELQRAMVLDVEASTAPGTFAKVVVVYPAKEKKSIKALHAVRDASRMLAEVNIPKRSDWAGGGTMVGGGCMLTRDGLLKPNYAAKPGCQLARKHKVRTLCVHAREAE